jgi:hypothetical protein
VHTKKFGWLDRNKDCGKKCLKEWQRKPWGTQLTFRKGMSTAVSRMDEQPTAYKRKGEGPPDLGVT